MLLTWLTRVAQLLPAGLMVKDRTVRIIAGEARGLKG